MIDQRGIRTIAIEEHYSTPEVVKATTRDAGAVPEFVKRLRTKLLDLGDGRLADMDAAGVDMQVLSLVVSGVEELDPATATALAHDSNDTVAAAVRAHPDRFAAFCTVPQEKKRGKVLIRKISFAIIPN